MADSVSAARAIDQPSAICSSRALTQQEALHLSAWRLGQFGDELDFARVGVQRQARAHMLRQVGGERGARFPALPQDDEGLDDLGALWIWLADDGDFRDRGMFDHYALHVERSDAIAGGGDD